MAGLKYDVSPSEAIVECKVSSILAKLGYSRSSGEKKKNKKKETTFIILLNEIVVELGLSYRLGCPFSRRNGNEVSIFSTRPLTEFSPPSSFPSASFFSWPMMAHVDDPSNASGKSANFPSLFPTSVDRPSGGYFAQLEFVAHPGTITATFSRRFFWPSEGSH